MFNCEHNDIVCQKYKCTCTWTISSDIHYTINLIYNFENGDTLNFLINLHKTNGRANRIFIIYKKVYNNCTFSEKYMYDDYENTTSSNISRNCIPYFQIIGFNGYTIQEQNHDSILIDKNKLNSFLRNIVFHMAEQGLIQLKIISYDM